MNNNIKKELFSIRGDLHEMINKLEEECIKFEENIKNKQSKVNKEDYLERGLIEIDEELSRIDIKYKSQYYCVIITLCINLFLVFIHLIMNDI